MTSNPDARLSAQRALVGAVGPGLLAACIQVQDGTVTATWYVRPEFSEDEREDLLAAGSEIIADFPDDISFEEDFIEVESPDQPCVGSWVFKRRTPST